MLLSKNGPKARFPEHRGSLAGLRYPSFAEIKYDGEAMVIVYQRGAEIFAANKHGTIRTKWDKLVEIADIMRTTNLEYAYLYCELFYGEGKNQALYQLLKHKDSDDLNFIIYDMAIRGVVDTRPLVERKEMITELFRKKYLGQCRLVTNATEAHTYALYVMGQGYEGVVVKSLDSVFQVGPCPWVKIKCRDTNVYEVHSISSTQERIEIIVPLPNTSGLPSPNSHTLGISCGVKVSAKHKKNLKVGDKVVIQHLGVLDSGSLRNPIFIKKEGEEE